LTGGRLRRWSSVQAETGERGGCAKLRRTALKTAFGQYCSHREDRVGPPEPRRPHSGRRIARPPTSPTAEPRGAVRNAGYRRAEGDHHGQKQWRPLRKGVADLHRRTELSQRANERYLAGLAAAQTGQTLADLVDPLCKAVTWKGRRVRAMNPLAAEDLRLLQALGRGEYLVQGLRNRDLRQALYGSESKDPRENRRRSSAVTRKLRLLRAHRLIHKVPRTHRYLISPRGQAVLAALLAARQADTEKLAAVA